MKSFLHRLLSSLLLIVLCCAIFTAGYAEAVDYSSASAWAYFQIAPEKNADLFLICPTVDMGKNGNHNMSLADEATKASFLGALNMERGIYEETLTLYAPYYRQAAFPVYSLAPEEAKPYFELAYQDVREAFLYFIAHTGERPFVLAGFSQGADMVLRLMKEFFSHPAYQNRLIAAYCIGWRVTQDDLNACPWLQPAQGKDDLGAIVCFNTEAEEITESMLVPAGVKTYGINPLNWKTDSTPAGKEENLGACFTNYNGEITKEIPGLTGAYLDETRGTLKAPDVVPKDYANKLFPDGVYHLFDYQFFYRNLQQNVALRTETYLAAPVSENAA